jgi:hypothetical protein
VIIELAKEIEAKIREKIKEMQTPKQLVINNLRMG